jgi:hypothetical protein
VIGYEGLYEVSDHGRVRSLDRVITCKSRWGGTLSRTVLGKMLQTYSRSDIAPYLCVTLCKDGVHTQRDVHVLVLEAFEGPCMPGFEGCHNNDVGYDNRRENLRWDTHQANMSERAAFEHYNTRKTSCKYGHDFTPTNTISLPNGTRQCRECTNRRTREYRQRERNVS